MARKTDTTGEAGAPAKRANEPHADVRYWLNEISAARKREKDWRKDGERIIKIYSGEKQATTPFNILYSNTETLLPALYSAVPRPVVSRRFKDDDPIGKEAARAGQRCLEFLVDTNVDGYETFDEGCRAATLDGLLPGRGVTCVKYDAEVGEVADAPAADTDATAAADSAAIAQPATTPYKASELVCADSRAWSRVCFGYAKKWSKMPWIAYEEHIDREEAIRLFGEEKTKLIKFTKGEDRDREDDKGNDDRNQGERKTACVYQIWDKRGGRKIRYVSAQYIDGYLKVDDDPLELTGFFNTPKPLQFLEKTDDLIPTALYSLYENQAKEINSLTLRISRIAKAIKARGIYDAELGDDIAKLLEADDNELVPADKSSSLAAEKGLQNAIWFAPIADLITTLNQLIIAREQSKRVVYEITGISDIIRGSTVASETATAQEIKSQWGTLRLKRLQKEVQRYARDLLRIMLEIAATKFSEETWARMTGLPFLTQSGKAQLDQLMMAAQAAQASGQQVDPQTAQQIQMGMQIPVWADVLKMLRDDFERAYRIDIETNSTVEPEAAEDQKQIAELMNALGQFLNGVAPLVQSGAMPFEIAQSMLLAISRRFRFGSEIEDHIKGMSAPKPEDNGAEKAALQAQQQQMQKDAQAAQKTTADAGEIQRLKTDLDAEKRGRALDKQEADLALREATVTAKEGLLGVKEGASKQVRDADHKAKSTESALQNEKQVSRTKDATAQQEKSRAAMDEKAKQMKGDSTAVSGIVKNEIRPIIEALKQVAGAVNDISAVVAKLKEYADSEKPIERDESGRISKIGKRRVSRNESGQAVALQ